MSFGRDQKGLVSMNVWGCGSATRELPNILPPPLPVKGMGKLLFCSSFKLLPFFIKQKPSLTDSVELLLPLYQR
jgi:hypothetical protein